MTRVGIITNPHSKLNKSRPENIAAFKDVSSSKADLFITNTPEELDKVAKVFKNKKYDVLAINGGDGTISLTLTAFIKVYKDQPLPTIALLRGGTFNLVAANLNIFGSPLTLLKKLLNESPNKKHQTYPLKTLKVDNNYGFLFANGGCYKFLEVFYKNKTGPAGALSLIGKLAASRFLNKKFYDAMVPETETFFISDGRAAFSHKSCSILAATVPRMPLGPRLFPSNTPESKTFHWISATTPSSQAWITIPPSVLLHPGKDDAAKQNYQSKSLILKTAKPQPYTLDGELYEPEKNEVHISLGPEIDVILL